MVYGILTRRKLMIAHSFGRPAPNSDSRRMMNIGAADYAVAQAYTMSQVMCADNSLCAKVLAKLLMRASEMRREKKQFGIVQYIWRFIHSSAYCTLGLRVSRNMNWYGQHCLVFTTHFDLFVNKWLCNGWQSNKHAPISIPNRTHIHD